MSILNLRPMMKTVLIIAALLLLAGIGFYFLPQNYQSKIKTIVLGPEGKTIVCSVRGNLKAVYVTSKGYEFARKHLSKGDSIDVRETGATFELWYDPCSERTRYGTPYKAAFSSLDSLDTK